MKIKTLLHLLTFLFLVNNIYAFSDEDILNALQKRSELLDPDSAMYLKAGDKAAIQDFLDKNASLFSSLGARETWFYIKLIDLNRNPNMNATFAMCVLDSYKRFFNEYSISEHKEIERNLTNYRSMHLITPKQFDEIAEKKMPK